MQQLLSDYGNDQTLRLNVGNSFKRNGELERRRAQVILQAYALMGYEVYAIGPYDAVLASKSLRG